MDIYLKNPKSIVILGYPLEHTFSPLIHNYAFKYHNLDYVYTAFPIKPDELTKLGKDFLKVLPIYAGNVTVPFKEIIFNYLDKFTNDASEIGAVNTFYKKDGELWGDNTDLYGFIKSLEGYENFIQNQKVIVLGTGGSAKAVCSGLAKLGAKEIVIISRDKNKAKTFSDNYQGKYSQVNFTFNDYSYFDEKKNIENIKTVINTTPVGMYENQAAIASETVKSIDNNTLFYDLIYNPETTTFLRYAKETNKTTLNGKNMLIYQAAKAFKIWTGYEFPVSEISNLKLY